MWKNKRDAKIAASCLFLTILCEIFSVRFECVMCVCVSASHMQTQTRTACVQRRDDAKKIRRWCDGDNARRRERGSRCKTNGRNAHTKKKWRKNRVTKDDIDKSKFKTKEKKQNKRGDHLWLIVAGCRKSHIKCHSFVWMGRWPDGPTNRPTDVRMCSVRTDAIVTELETIH